jgi:hypothetical protein
MFSYFLSVALFPLQRTDISRAGHCKDASEMFFGEKLIERSANIHKSAKMDREMNSGLLILAYHSIV